MKGSEIMKQDILDKLVARVEGACRSPKATQKTIDWGQGYIQALSDVLQEERLDLEAEVMALEKTVDEAKI